MATLGDDQLEVLLRKLVETETLDDYIVQHLLIEAANRSPQMTVRTLIERIRRSEDAGSDYRPLPYIWAVDGMANVTETNEAEAILSDIFNLSTRDTWQCRFWAPKLFRAVSGGLGPAVLALLQRWIRLGDGGRLIAVSNLLSDAPSGFVLTKTDFVAQLLQRAAAVGEDCLNQVRSALFSSALSGVRSAAPGEPFLEDVERRDQAASIAAGMAPGSPAQRFYADLVSDAERSIKDKLSRDEELLD
jgi:hypothetical protein